MSLDIVEMRVSIFALDQERRLESHEIVERGPRLLFDAGEQSESAGEFGPEEARVAKKSSHQPGVRSIRSANGHILQRQRRISQSQHTCYKFVVLKEIQVKHKKERNVQQVESSNKT